MGKKGSLTPDIHKDFETWAHRGYTFQRVLHPKTPAGHQSFNVKYPNGEQHIHIAKDHQAMSQAIEMMHRKSLAAPRPLLKKFKELESSLRKFKDEVNKEVNKDDKGQHEAVHTDNNATTIKTAAGDIRPEDHATILDSEKHKDLHWKLARSGDLHVQAQAKILDDDKHAHLREDLAENDGLHPLHQAKTLDDDRHKGLVRLFLAGNPSLHPDLQAKILDDDKHKDLRKELFFNKNLDHGILMKLLSDDRYKDLRAEVAEDPRVHPHQLRFLR